MNRKFIVALTILLLGSSPLFAQEEPNMADYLLIDFSLLAPGYQPEPEGIYQRQTDPIPVAEGSDPTVVAFTSARAALTPDESAAMKDSLALDRWQIQFSPSARWKSSIVNSYVLSYPLRESATMYAGKNVLAARLHLSPGQFNTHARILPPFNIPAYAKEGEGVTPNELNTDDDPWGQFLHRGVLRNVGNIRSISAWIFGRNVPLSFKVLLNHESLGKMEIPLGTLDFLGWRKLTWLNPSYIQDVRKREPVANNHVYPDSTPSLVFEGFELTRDFSVAGGERTDVVFYAKSVEVIFDKANYQSKTADVDDEKIWQVVADRSRASSQKHNEKSSDRLERRYYQLQNRIPFAPSDGNPSSTTSSAGTTPAPANG